MRLGLRQSLSGAARHSALLLVLAAKPPKPATNIFFGGGFTAPEPHQGDFDVALLPQNMSLHFKNVCAILSVRGYEHIRKAHDAWKEITSMYRKEIIYDRETRDYAMYLDGELVGFARTYHEAEVTLDQLVFELMTGQYFREAA